MPFPDGVVADLHVEHRDLADCLPAIECRAFQVAEQFQIDADDHIGLQPLAEGDVVFAVVFVGPAIDVRAADELDGTIVFFEFFADLLRDILAYARIAVLQLD